MGQMKKLKKRIDGIAEAIKEHEEKLAKYKLEDGRNYALMDYWEKEISKLKQRKIDEEERLE